MGDERVAATGDAVNENVTLLGGAWLVENQLPRAIFTRERFDDEQRLIGQTAESFIDGEVLPVLDRLEQKDWALARRLIERCGELGLLATDVAESFGGLDLDKISSIIVGEAVGRCASFATTFGAQTGLVITPIVCFGTEGQKEKYLPKLVSGEMIGAYALSESGSGSDALGAKARATREADGSFRLSGEKMWITNGGFADVFIVFAKVDGEHFTAFIVERAFPGVSSGKEEHKMGLLGSSTTPLILQDARVPAENLLGEIGKGHRIAFNTLNYGRLKLGAMCSGGARVAIDEAVRYASDRRQFGRPIASFGAIAQKLGEMTVRQYALEAMLYRTAGQIDTAIGSDHSPARVLAAFEEFAIESSIVKVAGSEAADFIFDENVQIHGGNGFVRDYPAERRYRDGRVNRIFEGTNEINRLLIPGLAVRRAAKGSLPIQSLLSGTADGGVDGEGAVGATVRAMKRTTAFVLDRALGCYGEQLGDQQEVLSAAADLMIDVYAAESALLRAMAAGSELHRAAAEVGVAEGAARARDAARIAFCAMGRMPDVDEAERILRVPPVDVVSLRRALAAAAVDRRAYPF
jgi:alkylation response protein AidB-like acyl-CoA dehydrogenase